MSTSSEMAALKAESILRSFGLAERWASFPVSGLTSCIVLVHRSGRHEPIALGGLDLSRMLERVERWAELETRRQITGRQETGDADE